jgi:dinuclear metal center YbgI/SA1388 family protein
MKIKEVTSFLESLAPVSLQESYDNAGLLTGDENAECTGTLISLDATEEVIKEAISKNCNLVISHHPVIFSGIKKITGNNYVGRAVIAAIKNDISLYAIHTNLDNILQGVNGKIAAMLDLKNTEVLSAKSGVLKKLYTFIPVESVEKVRQAIFEAGAGHIGNYSECSFNAEGYGTFKAGEGADPFVGLPGQLHTEKEIRVEVIFPAWLQNKVVQNMLAAHPYEEVAYDIISIENNSSAIGSGLIGKLENPEDEIPFLSRLKNNFGVSVIKHTPLLNRPIQKVAVCGGAGSFLITKALAAGADIFITSDIRYHDFFEANGRMIIADIGHYESEQFTINLLQNILEQKFPTFAVLKTEVNTNPVCYFK